MSRDISSERGATTDPIEELYALINNKRNTTLGLEDLKKYYEKRDKSLGDYAFDDSKYINFIEKNTNTITKRSLKEGFEKEVSRVKEEIALIIERIDLELALINDIERKTEDDIRLYSEEDGEPYEPRMLCSVIQLRNYTLEQELQDRKLSVVISSGEHIFAVEPMAYAGAPIKWNHERFTLPILSEDQEILLNVYEVQEQDGELLWSCVSGTWLKLETMHDQKIHKRFYKLYYINQMVCEVEAQILYVHNYAKYLEEKLERRREVYQMTYEKNIGLLKFLDARIQKLQAARGMQLFEELFTSAPETEVPNFLSPRRFDSPRFPINKNENDDYISESASVYEDNIQLKLFLSGDEEEKYVFEKNQEPNQDLSLEGDMLGGSAGPKQTKTSMLDNPLSDSRENIPKDYLSDPRQRSAERDRKNEKGKHGLSNIFTDSTIVANVNNSTDEGFLSVNHGKLNGTFLNLSGIIPTKETKTPNDNLMKKNVPKILIEEVLSSSNLKGKEVQPRKKLTKEEFYEKAVMLGLAKMMAEKKK